MRTKSLCIIALAAVILTALPAWAQKKEAPFPDSITEDVFFPNLQADPEMKSPEVGKKPFTISYGGWITPTVIDDRKNADSDLMMSYTTVKLWMQMSLWQNAFIHVRGKDAYSRVITEKNQGGVEDWKNVLDLDVGFIHMATSGRALQLALGRKFYIIGTGLVFNGRGDGGELDLYTRVIDVKLFGLYTGYLQKDSNPYGLSDKDFSSGATRIFAGGTLEKSFANQTIYLLGLAQIDQGDEPAGTNTRYQSQYYGAGMKGVVLTSMDYYAEFIYEMGESYISATNEKKDIAAMAGMFGVNWYIDAPMNPALMFQYAYGSGDADRAGYKSTGNTKGDDTGFISFGTFVGGFALRPQLSNLHIARLGIAISPFYASDKPYLKRINLIPRYSYYMKDKPGGNINSGEAASNSRDVGHGVDMSLRWGIFYDLSLFANYGLFLPGEAYKNENNDPRHFIMGGFNLVF